MNVDNRSKPHENGPAAHFSVALFSAQFYSRGDTARILPLGSANCGHWTEQARTACKRRHRELRELIGVSAGHKPAVRTNLQPQFFPERLALLETFEELFENADHNRVDADAFRFSPLF